jgi:hypothetical protein
MGNKIAKMILNMTEHFRFIEELLTAKEWQHLEADNLLTEVAEGENEEKE